MVYPARFDPGDRIGIVRRCLSCWQAQIVGIHGLRVLWVTPTSPFDLEREMFGHILAEPYPPPCPVCRGREFTYRANAITRHALWERDIASTWGGARYRRYSED